VEVLARQGSDKAVYTIKQDAVSEITEKKSRFISYAIKTETEKDALAELEKIKSKYPDATHHVYAYVVNDQGVVYHRYSDDREPSGTAGLPTLDVLKKGNIENVLLVTVRYFGGTLLGTGGLTRTYGLSAKKAVKQAGLVKRVDCAVFTLTADYSSYEKIKRLLDECVVMDTEFGELVTVRFAAEDLKAEERIGRMNELLNSRCVIERKNNIVLEI
jgi:uncharacterized YigZ family protein